MSSLTDRIETAVKPVIESLGYELVDVESAKKHNQEHITIYIDIVRGVNLDDCEKVHNAINPVMDELNPYGEAPYVLNVSSPGLDRPFKKQRDYERNYEKGVEIKLFAPLKGKKIFEGILINHNENTTTIKTDKEEIKFENTKVAKVSPLVKFE